MFDWLFEGWTVIYLLLASAAAIFLLIWWQNRQRVFAIALLVVVALAGLYFALNLLVETDRKQIERSLQELAQAVKKKDLSLAFAHVSEKFSRNGRNKQEFRQQVDGLLPRYSVEKVVFWDYRFLEVSRAERTAKVLFRVKVTSGASSEGFFLSDCEARFTLDPDGRWRLQGFKLFFPPYSDQEWPGPF